MSDDLHDLAPLYAVDALDPLEARRFEAHLDGCEPCRAEVADVRATAAALGRAVAVPPPADLKARVLAQVAATPQVPVEQAAPSGRSGRTTAAPRGRWLLAAAAAVVVLVAGMGLLVRDLTSQRDRAEELAAVLAAGDARDAVLEGSTGSGMRVVWSPGEQATVLVGRALPPAASGHAYELWTFTPTGPVSAGVFEPGADGDVRVRLDLPADQVDGWGVTVEPTGGGPGPEGELVLRTA